MRESTIVMASSRGGNNEMGRRAVFEVAQLFSVKNAPISLLIPQHDQTLMREII